MNGPTRTWNAVVVGEDTPCWSGITVRTYGPPGHPTTHD